MKYVLLALFALTIGCGKGAGSKCKGPESMCVDKKSALACHDGVFEKVECAGPLGCSKFQDHANCDDSVSNVGAACMGTGEEEYACSPDKKRALVCKGKKFERYLECRGPAACALFGQQVSCDTSIAAKGDPCKTQGTVACGDDQKQMLICRDGKFDLYRYCRGQYGCRTKDDVPSCDETLSVEGDPCGMPGRVVCSTDGKSELVCQGSTYTKSLSCPKRGCTVTNRSGRPIDCD